MYLCMSHQSCMIIIAVVVYNRSTVTWGLMVVGGLYSREDKMGVWISFLDEKTMKTVWRSQQRILAWSRKNPPTHYIYRPRDGLHTTLRIDLGDHDGNKHYAKYSSFQVTDSSTSYRLTVSGYSGDAGDSLSYHNGMMFTTTDHQVGNSYCAVSHTGAWWYNQCHYSNLNGMYSSSSATRFQQGVIWYHWKGHSYSLKFTGMKVRQEA